ncbi:MAG: 3'-5' exonuclease, partial [Thermodesulfobacteriota bacterium]|nr:3'-5' exonuclease [Thermodesulfobacteriota bacterium]
MSESLQMNIVAFDTETTGLSPRQGHRIIEIGAVKLVNGQIIDEFHSLINAGIPIARQAQAVHGINQAMLHDQPLPEEVFHEFYDFIGQSIMVAHNAPFDQRFLATEFSLFGLRMPAQFECTLKLSRRLLDLNNYRLDTVYKHLGGIVDSSIQQHRAIDDARMAAFVW